MVIVNSGSSNNNNNNLRILNIGIESLKRQPNKRTANWPKYRSSDSQLSDVCGAAQHSTPQRHALQPRIARDRAAQTLRDASKLLRRRCMFCIVVVLSLCVFVFLWCFISLTHLLCVCFVAAACARMCTSGRACACTCMLLAAQ